MKFDDFLRKAESAFREHMARRFAQSWCFQEREERNLRLKAIIRLSAEFERVTAVSIQASAFGKAVIEAIIRGDWKEAEENASYLAFEDDYLCGSDRERYAQLWENFVILTRMFCAEAKRRSAGQRAMTH